MSKSHKPEAYIEQIAAHPLFCGVESEKLCALLAQPGVAVARYARGEMIYSPNGFSRSLGLILSGRASVRKQQSGASMLMSTLKENDLFGAATLFTDASCFVAKITAEQNAWVLMIAESAFSAMMQKEFRIAENYMRYLTARIRFLSARIDGFVQPGCEERVLLLLRQRAQDGVFTMERGASAMAETLCMSRASLYRVLDTLSEKGFIVRSGKSITLLKGEKQ